MKNFYVTSPIFYPNAQPHLGHAYTTLLCDVLVRHHRLLGEESYFLTGTDEHTEKVVKAATALNQSPEEYLEKIVARFKAIYADLNIQYDQFIRTSDRSVHWPGAIEMWNRLVQAGDLYKSQYVGLYCIGCETFKTEKDLINGLCPDHGVASQRISEENYFFRLSKYSQQLERLIETEVLPITPVTRKTEILKFIRAGLEDVSFSRPKGKMTWGIPVPGDDSQTMYIWVDALTNYISALGFGRGEELMRFWPGTHVIGKDILRFHAIFWPAMLLSAGLPLPKSICVHGTIISGGQKMSKSIGNVIGPDELISKYGAEATRYLLLRHVNATEDTDVTWERLDEWYTANLTNGLGNLVARVMKLAEEHLSPLELGPEDTKIESAFTEKMEAFRFNEAMDLVWEHVGKSDLYMTEHAPYAKFKTEPEEAKKDIEKLVRHLAKIAAHLVAVMPTTAELIMKAVRENKKPENLFPRLP